VVLSFHRDLGHPAMIQLTEQQRQAIKNGEAIRLPSSEIGEDVVLLRATQFDSMQEAIEDNREQAAVLRYSMKQAAKVASENPY
jgi:NADH/NAD ratio-sensing transcriptional regulator Rex